MFFGVFLTTIIHMFNVETCNIILISTIFLDDEKVALEKQLCIISNDYLNSAWLEIWPLRD